MTPRAEVEGPGGHLGDLPPEEFRRYALEAVDWMVQYLRDVGDMPVLGPVEPGELRSALPSAAPDEGESLDEILDDFRELVVPRLNHWNHPAFFGYFPTSASGPGVLAEMLTAALNVNAMVWRSSPAATELEGVATDWLRDLLGLPDAFEGVINDTASSSSLYALAAAREVAYRGAHRSGLFGQPPGRVYASDQAHSSIEKAVIALGLGQEGYARVPSGTGFAMRADALSSAIRDDLGRGVRPVAVVATIGTTSTASVDPVRHVAEVAREHGVWLHLDAAYGGPAAIVPECRSLFDGWERADSIVVNPHKWLFTPVDCSVLFCRRPDELLRAFSIVPEYLSSAGQDRVRDLMDYGISLGRRFRSLKLWFVLRYFGRAGIEARLRDHIEMTRELAGKIEDEPHWTVVAPVHFATVAFRFEPAESGAAESDGLNRAILDRVNATGETFLTHTVVGGRFVLRLSVGNIRTTREHVERAWALLRDAAFEVSGR